MKGTNELTLCMAELLVAVQEYLDKRMGEYAPEADNIKEDKCNFNFVIGLKERSHDNTN